MTINPDLCTRCGTCVEECPRLQLELPRDGSVPLFYNDACHECGHCEAVCPTCALTLHVSGPSDLLPAMDILMPGREQVNCLLRTRRSIRRYTNRPVPRAELEAILDIVRWAPTSGNSQTVQWIILESRHQMDRFVAETNRWLHDNPLGPAYGKSQARAENGGTDLVCRGAPHAIIATAAVGRETDGAVALAHLELAAYSAGIGACWSGFANMAIRGSADIRRWLRLSDSRVPCGVMLLGYPEHRFHRIPRRNPLQAEWR